MVLATESVEWRRFAHPRQLASYLGLVPREHSSGEREWRGSITKAGNRHGRPVLSHAAWRSLHRPQVSAELKRRQQGQPPAVIAHAWKAHQRLPRRVETLRLRQ